MERRRGRRRNKDPDTVTGTTACGFPRAQIRGTCDLNALISNSSFDMSYAFSSFVASTSHTSLTVTVSMIFLREMEQESDTARRCQLEPWTVIILYRLTRPRSFDPFLKASSPQFSVLHCIAKLHVASVPACFVMCIGIRVLD